MILGVINHQMNIQRQGCQRTQCADHRSSESEVWYKMAIHYVDMDPVTAVFGNMCDSITQSRKIGT